jgi:hypothetical protein
MALWFRTGRSSERSRGPIGVHASRRRFSELGRRRAHPQASTVEVAGSLVGMAFCGAIAWVIYLSIAWGGCNGGGGEFVMFDAKHGGAASNSSLLVAGLVGICLWLALGVIGVVFRSKAHYLLVSFIALYAIGLVVLWSLAPVFWGARHCTL